jgi:hypothetical protein
MVYLRVTSALAAAALLTLVPHAQAQSLPPEGELTSNQLAHYVCVARALTQGFRVEAVR